MLKLKSKAKQKAKPTAEGGLASKIVPTDDGRVPAPSTKKVISAPCRRRGTMWERFAVSCSPSFGIDPPCLVHPAIKILTNSGTVLVKFGPRFHCLLVVAGRVVDLLDEDGDCNDAGDDDDVSWYKIHEQLHNAILMIILILMTYSCIIMISIVNEYEFQKHNKRNLRLTTIYYM